MMSHEFSRIFTDFIDILQILDYVSRIYLVFSDDVSPVLTDFHRFSFDFSRISPDFHRFSANVSLIFTDFSDILQILYDVSPIFTDS